jgi:transcription initiation factor TFIIH subunit 3
LPDQARESLGRACPQYLLTVFAADGFSRRFLALPRSTSVDFRASCFCHKRSIDQGFVCSVCLSIFCERCDKCSTCQTTFHVAKVPAKRGPNAVLAPAGA